MLKFSAILIVCLIKLANSEFSLNDIKLEALKPKGMRVSIPDQPGIQYIGFHGRLKEPLDIAEQGELYAEIKKPTKNLWIYENLDVQLQPGDEVHYWIYAQYNRLGYRKDKQKWTVTELVPGEGITCQKSETIASGKETCKDTKILHDQFKSTISTSDWIQEQYIPRLGPNYEFVSYRNRDENVYIMNEVLHLKPVPTLDAEKNLEMLNLQDKCTSTNKEECSIRKISVVIIPPVTSGKVRSKLSFRFGQVEIKAKLPKGDWIYPIIQLQSVNNANASIWIAYSRGNDHLTSGNDDIGSRILFGGPVLSPFEPTRSQYLRSHNLGSSFYSDVRTYKCIWEYGRIRLWVDNINYGTVDTKGLPEFNNDEFYLTLGVGVGGINDFPEGYESSGTKKPWNNRHRKFTSQFRDAKDQWFKTWTGDQCSLQIDTVTVTAI